MSREARINRTIRRALDRQRKEVEEKNRPEKRAFLKKAVAYVTFVLGVPGIVAGILSLLPRLSVTPQPPLMSSNAFTSPFLVSNDGFIPIYDITTACTAKGVLYVDPDRPKHQLTLEWEGGDEGETGGVSGRTVAPKIDPTGKVAFDCGLLNVPVPGDWVRTAHILFIVKYHAPLLPFIPRYHRQRFELIRDSSGETHWLEEPNKT